MMIEKIDSFEAYVSMYVFLSVLYEESQMDDLGSILGDLRINPDDGIPMDSAMKEDWQSIVKKHFGDQKQFSSIESYQTMLFFLDDLITRFKSSDIKDLINELKISEKDAFIFDKWNQAIAQTLKIYR